MREKRSPMSTMPWNRKYRDRMLGTRTWRTGEGDACSQGQEAGGGEGAHQRNGRGRRALSRQHHGRPGRRADPGPGGAGATPPAIAHGQLGDPRPSSAASQTACLQSGPPQPPALPPPDRPPCIQPPVSSLPVSFVWPQVVGIIASTLRPCLDHERPHPSPS